MAGARYTADADGYLTSVALDGLSAVYHRPSGMTHILAEPAPQLLAALADKPATLEELTARIGEQFDLEQGEALEARLAELETAGLVRRT